ncbi:MAG: N,N-dimethylformamidase beta subunit family domain-containing protein [Hyphomicrobiales bacterium]
MIPLIGYVDRLSARAGDTLNFKVSSTGDEPFEARLIRIICADPNPEGPGVIHEEIASDFGGTYPSRPQHYDLGSCVHVQVAGDLAPLRSFTLTAVIWPTTHEKGRQGVISCAGEAGAHLYLDQQGCVSAELGGHGSTVVGTGVPLKARRWYRVWAAYDGETGQVEVGHQPLDGSSVSVRACENVGAGRQTAVGGTVLIAARGGDKISDHFNGKIEAPAIYDRAIEGGDAGTSDPGGCVACWDFSRGICSLKVEDTGPNRLHGEIVNLPARGMTGSTWRGQEMCWRHAPEHYGAIHFHDDDFYDCAWETDFSFTVPESLNSGVYAARLRCDGHEDTIPFFVCPPRGKRHADLCVIVPTFTYVIYSNNARYDFGPALEQRMEDWNAYPWNPARHPEYGLSAYNLHSDGSGICHVSSLRPMMTLKSGYLTLLIDGCGSGHRHFQADTHLLAWLDHQGIAFDVVTDQELNDDGPACLEGYKAVLTTTHPEYHTANSLDAVEGYIGGGGNFCYLGGNGFYWRVALHAEAAGAIEIRRGEGGIRTWAAAPGEYYNAFDGHYGGLWRRNCRPPQKIAGTGFSAQGTFVGSYFRRTERSYEEDVSWIFDGVEGEVLGDFGLSGGGAAGYELDRVDPALGSPDNVAIVACSENHIDTYVAVPEELLTHVSTVTGENPEDLIRADMVYYETPAGGAVFSASSITFCGSLPHNGFDNNTSKLLLNVVTRFLG